MPRYSTKQFFLPACMYWGKWHIPPWQLSALLSLASEWWVQEQGCVSWIFRIAQWYRLSRIPHFGSSTPRRHCHPTPLLHRNWLRNVSLAVPEVKVMRRLCMTSRLSKQLQCLHTMVKSEENALVRFALLVVAARLRTRRTMSWYNHAKKYNSMKTINPIMPNIFPNIAAKLTYVVTQFVFLFLFLWLGKRTWHVLLFLLWCCRSFQFCRVLVRFWAFFGLPNLRSRLSYVS